MGTIIVLSKNYESDFCSNDKCRRTFFIDQSYLSNLKKTGNTFWCPYCGEGQRFNIGTTKEDELKKELENKTVLAQQRLDYIESLEAEKDHLKFSNLALKGVSKRLRKKISKQ